MGVVRCPITLQDDRRGQPGWGLEPGGGHCRGRGRTEAGLQLMALCLPWCPPTSIVTPPPPVTLVWCVPQAASHDLTDSGRYRRGRSLRAFPTYGQRPVFSAGRGTQDGVLQPLKNSHPGTLGAGSLLDSEPPGVPGGSHGAPRPSRQVLCRGRPEATTQSTCLGFSTCRVTRRCSEHWGPGGHLA